MLHWWPDDFKSWDTWLVAGGDFRGDQVAIALRYGELERLNEVIAKETVAGVAIKRAQC